ncbi:hypothetical protein, unlikely [Trypanosoma brucei gambiense DAL972]|uniref:Uncharacterized protein n=1 Tax=Trypanosoma brucei gambiense (strain MHOM/CI/86/DAL972) TaxID=679716 RepID=C9ZVZ6_TRYB9|nr:hypothetical protein, unlikely [Trypanosoma brucei gambiense DAL972]CBH13584.1 hypothetical protein, unlikely [Trypanosoma brucei gambiense DAL972]|eukprot:XP_011775861.1 hypothetical protein, unlikely [Trypanosoma brucei gambiense DAL972]
MDKVYSKRVGSPQKRRTKEYVGDRLLLSIITLRNKRCHHPSTLRKVCTRFWTFDYARATAVPTLAQREERLRHKRHIGWCTPLFFLPYSFFLSDTAEQFRPYTAENNHGNEKTTRGTSSFRNHAQRSLAEPHELFRKHVHWFIYWLHLVPMTPLLHLSFSRTL